MELTYHWEGDVLIPDLELEDGNNYQMANMAECDRGICLKIIMPCIHIWFLRKNCGNIWKK